MREPVRALLWQTRGSLTTHLVVPLACWALFWTMDYTFLLIVGYDEPWGQEVDAYMASLPSVVLVLLWAAFSVPIQERDHSPFPFRTAFALPVKTPVLVVLPMACVLGVVALSYILPALLIRAVHGFPLPLLDGTLTVLAFSCVYLAFMWSFASLRMRVAGTIISLFFFTRLSRIWDSTQLANEGSIFSHALFYVVVFLTFSATVSALLLSVKRQRCGEPVEPLWMRRLAARIEAAFPERTKLFDSPWSAQFWAEVQHVGVPIALTGILVAVISLVYVLVKVALGGSLADAGHAYYYPVHVVVPLLAVAGARRAVGLRGLRGGRLSSFHYATRPLNTNRMVWLKLAVLTGAVGVAGLSLAGAVSAWILLAGDIEACPEFLQGVWLTATALSWREWPLVLLFCAVQLLAQVSVLLGAMWRYHNSGTLLSVLYLLWWTNHLPGRIARWAGNTGDGAEDAWVSVLITAWLFFRILNRSLRQGRFSLSVLILGAGIWLGHVAGFYCVWLAAPAAIHVSDLPASVLALCVAFLLWPLAAIAMPFLGLEKMRHQ